MASMICGSAAAIPLSTLFSSVVSGANGARPFYRDFVEQRVASQEAAMGQGRQRDLPDAIEKWKIALRLVESSCGKTKSKV
jgi:hypothetical protein